MNQIKRKFSVALAGAAVITLSGCATSPAGKVDKVDLGDIHVLAVHGQRNFGGPIHFSGTVHASSLDGREDVAEKLNRAIAASGFKVSADHPTIQYTVKEVYAGPADQYKPAQASDNISAGTVTSVLGTGVAVGLSCWLLSDCSNPLVLGNSLTQDANAAAADLRYHQNADAKQAATPAHLLVVNQICQIGSCAMAYASSTNTSITLDQLRDANAVEGMPRAISVKRD
ncbi:MULTISPECIES: hypothetical protein [Caballeronia]|uniref:hypothetical protein n=1 Tax=Caballeronia TaxID=1827195 RepID=UPI001FCFEACB|nr:MULTISPECIES: hypothetical protein [Caballeronia]MDR5799059.1 hypothetical protein [Caballeronia sp. LZ001]